AVRLPDRRPAARAGPRSGRPAGPPLRAGQPARAQLRSCRPARRGSGVLNPAGPAGEGTRGVPAQPARRHSPRPAGGVMNDPVRRAHEYTLADAFRRAFRLYAGRQAVTWESGGYTYRELGERANQLAAALHGLGIRHGDRVAVLSETRPEYVETYAALAMLGVTALTLNIRLHPREL